MTQAAVGSDPHDDHNGHDAAHHDKNLAHHFDTPLQQFEAGKLGIWLFLTTEVLLFSGMFCAYAVYRANHPEVFAFADQWLDSTLGGINTLVLIFSSFTMAWAVRASQLGQKNMLCGLLAITFLCGCAFMCIKAVEYKAKWEHATLPGVYYNPKHLPPSKGEAAAEAHPAAEATATSAPATASAPAPDPIAIAMDSNAPAVGIQNYTPADSAAAQAAITAGKPYIQPNGYILQESATPRAAIGPRGMADASLEPVERVVEPNNVQVFFSIYFIMTGIHGIHVLGGMGVIAWLFFRARRGDFGPNYFNPVDFTGLYWHLVDLIWIFLFPLLYLIPHAKV